MSSRTRTLLPLAIAAVAVCLSRLLGLSYRTMSASLLGQKMPVYFFSHGGVS